MSITNLPRGPGQPASTPEYVTEVSVPSFGDGGVQRLHSHVLEPELRPEAEPGGEQDADRVTASRDDLAREYNHGAETAYQLTAHSAAGGRSADYIEGRHLELTGPTADQDQRTPAEYKWAQGYAAGAESSVSLLREREADDATEHAAQYELEAAG